MKYAKVRVLGSVASTKFNRFQPIKFKCHKINSIENQYFSYLSDSIFLKEKQKIDRCDRTHNTCGINFYVNNKLSPFLLSLSYKPI